MIFAGFSLVKLLSGFALWKGERLGKLIFYLIIIMVCLGIFWKLFIAPTNKTTQRADTITNITQVKQTEKTLIGIEIMGLKLGVRF